ncbi:hypothetical protein OTU49_003003 [Cherax quadricarinatus]|uniref:RUN domain-containing protein n=1 Tax=Cherax quadricarinatus TaxID=27406 RepID=A0AAW0XLT8_CHEQU|nr:uncharacterized protein LOC128693971 [Cherax quadricarinatus]XP_053639892.1 uncharacterized protein LOC128693971 [Cherax quadricarinatus]XP_053639893.1 uncharacterized protein LOC128693971 [Cherax quadricarinatus]
MFSQHLKRERREASISASLVTRLQEAVQSVLQPGGADCNYGVQNTVSGALGPIIGHSDNTNALCNVLEAIFIHGLRDSLGERMSSFLGSDPDRMPVPNFWPVVLIISHRDLIEQVSELSFISSEVGRSRAWVRLAINQGQICSYLSVLLHDSRTLKDYYRRTAFLRDAERSDIMLRVLQPVSALTFNLATNAAVLNTWTQTPLVLAGLWAPSVQVVVSDPVLAATDVASTVYDEHSTYMNSTSICETPISDQMFDMIIGGTPETSFINDYMEKHKKVDSADSEGIPRPSEIKANNAEEVNNDKDNFTAPCKEESDLDDHSKSETNLDDSILPNQKNQFENSLTNALSNRVYMREWSDDSFSRSMNEEAPEYKRLFSDFGSDVPFSIVPGLAVVEVDQLSPTTSSPSGAVSNESSLSEFAEKLNYEILPQQLPSQEDTSRLLPLLTRLTSEEGLDSQQYQCHQCKSYVGMIYGKPRVCNYDSRYYCYECHEDETALIPARILHNWDFSAHPVCTANARWLAAIHHQPLIDLRTLNPKLYCHVEDLAEMQMLRTQLLYVRAYLFTCRSGVGEQLRKMLWPREHMYEHVHLYSVADLQLVASGQLVPRVRQAVTFGREHISQCEVCSPRGFICELCSDTEIIYPFQLGNTYTCAVCYGVYHAVCARGRRKCPRCVRRAARAE